MIAITLTQLSKCNQTIKFSRLIEYTMTNIFFQKLYAESRGKIFSNAFVKNQSSAHLWMKNLKFYTVYFCCMSN